MSQFVSKEDWRPSDVVLEDAAEKVVRSDVSMSVIAGPGAGKTELLAQRALYLLQVGGCRPPQRILAISFKRDAAKTLKDRVARRCSPEQAKRFDSYTFDAFAKGLVDRFLALTPNWCRPPRAYTVLFPNSREWDRFLQSLNPPPGLEGGRSAQEVSREDVETWGPLPVEFDTPKDMRSWVVREWWRHCLEGSRPGMTFSMIRSLADAVLRHNPSVLRALQLTYPYVFLDEFQDTTRSQYALVELAFGGSGAVVTAVGDTKQRIMTWAGAEADVFDWFDRSFGAQRQMLQMNHRSNSRIVHVVNYLAKAIEPSAIETTSSRVDIAGTEFAAEFWQFATDDAEARMIADFIADDIAGCVGRAPDDFVLLVRVRADQHEERLAPHFGRRGLKLRNEARLIDGISIQDLVVDELVLLVLGVMKLALGVRGYDLYAQVQRVLGVLLNVDYENSRDIDRLDKKLRGLVSVVKELTGENPGAVDMAKVVGGVVSALDEQLILRTFAQYGDVSYLRKVWGSLAVFMGEVAAGVGDWNGVIESVEGKGQVRLMTIHKSKGLEYHTVFFVGLHERSFFGYRQNRGEETNVFFVALSRARERVFFTRSVESGRTTEIRELIELLGGAGVPTIRKA